MHGRPITPEEREQMIALAVSGRKLREIASTLNRPPGTVSRVLSDAILDGKLERRASREAPRAVRYYDRRNI